MKRFFSILIAIVCILSLGLVCGCQQSTPPEEPSGTASLTYKVQSDGSYFVKGITDSTQDIIVPATYKGKAVTGISDYAFENNYNIKSVSLPTSVKSIGQKAFRNCPFLATINLENVKFIKEGAFNNCSSLAGDLLLTSLIYIKAEVFFNCGKITSVTIGNSCVQVHADAFFGCNALTTIDIGSADGEWFYYLVRTDETGDQIRSESYGGSVAGFGERLQDPVACATMLKTKHNDGVFYAQYSYFVDYCNYTFELEGANGTQHQLDYKEMFS